MGTIDIFQGQEVPVTIISMTSSDAESLPEILTFSLKIGQCGSFKKSMSINHYNEQKTQKLIVKK